MALTLPSIQNCCRQPCNCDPSVAISETPLEWAQEDAYQITSATYDPTYLTIATGVVQWPNGILGSYTTLVLNTTFATVDSYSLTYPGLNGTVTITQPTVTRDADGSVINAPPLVQSP